MFDFFHVSSKKIHLCWFLLNWDFKADCIWLTNFNNLDPNLRRREEFRCEITVFVLSRAELNDEIRYLSDKRAWAINSVVFSSKIIGCPNLHSRFMILKRWWHSFYADGVFSGICSCLNLSFLSGLNFSFASHKEYRKGQKTVRLNVIQLFTFFFSISNN